MDRYKLPDIRDEKTEIFSNCSSCDEEIRLGDDYLDWYGQVCCDDKKCLMKMVDAHRKVAEDDE